MTNKNRNWVVRCPKSERCKVFDLKEIERAKRSEIPLQGKVLARGFCVIRKGKMELWHVPSRSFIISEKEVDAEGSKMFKDSKAVRVKVVEVGKNVDSK